MNGKTWGRRLNRIGVTVTPERNGQRRISLELIVQRLTPAEREEVADLRERIDAVGLEGMSDTELDRLETLIEQLENDPEKDGTG